MHTCRRIAKRNNGHTRTMTNQNDGDDSNKTVITLKGSVSIVSDFFFTAINSILYQRGTFGRTSACLQTVVVVFALPPLILSF
jgi:hypothetical protein